MLTALDVTHGDRIVVARLRLLHLCDKRSARGNTLFWMKLADNGREISIPLCISG
jgi:hypothetical protein